MDNWRDSGSSSGRRAGYDGRNDERWERDKYDQFRTEAQTVLLNRAYLLPALITYKFGGAVHSLVAAYAIYNDAKRFREIEASNPSDYPYALGPNVVAATYG
mgnify:CR=1 FL=1